MFNKGLLGICNTQVRLNTNSLETENESRILRWTRCIIEEAYSSIDTDEGEAPPNLEPASLGMAVLKLWARLFSTNTQWPFINVLGQSLEQYMTMI
jgi:hypothetical protein